MKIKMELELAPEFLMQIQKRADYLNERYGTSTMITARDIIKELILSKNVESVILPEYEKKLTIKNMEAYKEMFE